MSEALIERTGVPPERTSLPDTKPTCPDVAFLGACDRSDVQHSGTPATLRYSFINLSHYVIPIVFPFNLSSVKLVFAIFNPQHFRPTWVNLSWGNEVDLKWQLGVRPNDAHNCVDSTPQQSADQKSQFPIHAKDGHPNWSLVVVDLAVHGINFLIKEPGDLTVTIARGEELLQIGALTFVECRIPPFSSEETLALRSNPQAAKTVRFEMACPRCHDTIKTYAAFDISKSLEDNGYIRNIHLQDEFTCSCGRLSIPLRYLRSNLHAPLGRPVGILSQTTINALYDQNAIQRILNTFQDLISRSPREEEIHQFILENPLLLNQFSPVRVFSKVKILTEYVTDFAVLTPKGELVLIELEKTTTRLLNRDGGTAAELTHAFDQVNNWLVLAERFHAAVLNAFDLSPDEISRVRAVVIAGLNRDYDQTHLRNFKAREPGRVDFFSYDDLATHLVEMLRQLSRM